MLFSYPVLNRKFSLFIAASCLFVGIAANANASLLGQDVTGSLIFGGGGANFFDPANGFGAPFSKNTSTTVEIGNDPPPIVEFRALLDVGTTFQDYKADFTDNGLIITNDLTPPAGGWTMSFTSAAFVGLLLSELSDDFNNGGVAAALLGDTVTLVWAGSDVQPVDATAEYSLLAVQPVPLPAAFPLFAGGLGLMGLLGWRRKRMAAAAA